MKYLLSKLIPVRFTSSYRYVATANTEVPETQTWWQWRDRVFNQKVVAG